MDEQITATEEEARREATKKVMGEPVFAEFSETVQKARRNLLAVAMIANGFAWFGLELGSSQTMIGMQLQHLSNRVVAWGLLWVLPYLELHFLWLAWDALQEWRIRQSGAKSGGPQVGATWRHQDLDYPIDPRQSSLYRWWLEQSRSIATVGEHLKELNGMIREWRADRMPLGVAPPLEVTTLQNIEVKLDALDSQLKSTRDLINSTRIPASLERFDQAFYRFAKSQNLRWILLDFLTPVVFGAIGVVGAIVMLWRASH